MHARNKRFTLSIRSRPNCLGDAPLRPISETASGRLSSTLVGGGALEFPDGHPARLSSANFWQSEWVWQEGEKPLVWFKGRHGLVKARGAVEIQAEGV